MVGFIRAILVESSEPTIEIKNATIYVSLFLRPLFTTQLQRGGEIDICRQEIGKSSFTSNRFMRSGYCSLVSSLVSGKVTYR
jgi:hypothetical protein